MRVSGCATSQTSLASLKRRALRRLGCVASHFDRHRPPQDPPRGSAVSATHCHPRQQLASQTTSGANSIVAQRPPTLLLYDPAFALHLNGGPDHPERPDRFKHCLASLKETFPDEPDGKVRWVSEAPRATLDQITAVHTKEYALFLQKALDRAFDENRTLMFDGDTFAGPGTREAVLRGAGGVCAAVDAVCKTSSSAAGTTANAFCLVRPPGHHAEEDKAMGFCFLNNVMIGATHAIETHPAIDRVAIFDFDVHHGNGTAAQAMARGYRGVDNDYDVLYLSTHQHPFYPGTGAPMSYKPGGACGVVNVALREGDAGHAFRSAVKGLVARTDANLGLASVENIWPAIRDFGPDLIILSSGFDAHQDDPLASIYLTDEDYAWVTERSLQLAEELCAGRVVSVLEGGYNVPALARCVTAHVQQLASYGVE